MPDENASPLLTRGETEITRIGLGTNRLTKTPEHIAFVKRRSPRA